MLKAIIVDDEPRSRETIASIIKLYCSNVQVIAEADNITQAAQLISANHPDLIFLDIDMPGGSGFDLLKKYETIPFHVIFITAYQEHAVMAFKFSAIDYLLKPINPDELITAVNKAEAENEKQTLHLKLGAFLTNFKSSHNEKRIVLKTADQIHVISVRDIVRCEADRNYTNFFTIDGKKILVSTTIKEYDDLLSQYSFFRVHQSHLINMAFVDRVDKKEGGSVVMRDASQIPIAVRKKDALLSLLSSF